MITPNTDVYLLKCPLEIDDMNQLTFANATAQYNYFQSLPKLYLDDGTYTYQRKDGVIRVGELIDDIQSYNYVMYRNTNHSNKWFFAYITGMEYLNDNVTAVSIKTDTFQTWQFSLTYKRCFVEREHVNDDTFGKHTVPENLETGEYVSNYTTNILPYKKSFPHGADPTDPTQAIAADIIICFQVTEIDPLLPWISDQNWYGYMNSCFSGLFVFGVTAASTARKVINAYDNASKGDSIVSIFNAPVPFFNDCVMVTSLIDPTDKVLIPPVSLSNTILNSFTSYAMPSTLDGYSPKNNKVKCYPYNFISIDNHGGGSAVFNYELFHNNSPSFGIEGAFGQGCDIMLVPEGYKGDNSHNYAYGVAGAKYPQCAWRSDYYLNWLTQNAVNQPFGAATAIGGAALGIASGIAFSNPITALAAGVGLLGAIGDSISKNYEAQKHPDQAKGQASCGNMILGANNGGGMCFTLYKMSVKAEYAKMIDDFFSMFGYKVNEVKVPNITGRRNWNYVKTIGCYIDADIPQEDLKEIKDMFDKGITLWHNPTTFMDYSQANDII